VSDFGSAGFVKVRDDDARAFSGEAATERTPDAGRAAGNDGDFVFQFHAAQNMRRRTPCLAIWEVMSDE